MKMTPLLVSMSAPAFSTSNSNSQMSHRAPRLNLHEPCVQFWFSSDALARVLFCACAHSAGISQVWHMGGFTGATPFWHVPRPMWLIEPVP